MQQPPAHGGYVSYMSPLGYQNNSFIVNHPRVSLRSALATLTTPLPNGKCIQFITKDSSTEDGGGVTIVLLALDGIAFKPQKDQRKAVNRFTDHILGQEYKRLAARLCPKSREEKRRKKQNFDLCKRIHEAEYPTIKRPPVPKSGKPIEPAYKFEVSLESDTYTEEKYALFANYQKVVHKEPPSRISRAGFKSFLCSGMQRVLYKSDGHEQKIGSYHQCYRLDGRLVAIGVLDLMSDCVSSVYLIYHESVSEWEFGKLSALQEIALAVEGQYRYYYMGYYIHSCIKMRYKAAFHPTYLLDPESYNWDPLDHDLLARLTIHKYVSLSRERRLGILVHAKELESNQANKQLTSVNAHDSDSESDPESMSLFDMNMPGVMSPAEVMSQIPVAEVKARVNNKTLHLGWLGDWEHDDMKDSSTLHGVAAEFAACVGPSLAKEIFIDLGGSM
ncbi:Arginyl-tRNA--protein transferase 1 [Lambiella insularis]|nr:Arginyl-tRNA--protein transferase 1 [Lambiella insularis]